MHRLMTRSTGLLLLVLFLAPVLSFTNMVSLLDLRVVDVAFQIRGPSLPSDDIIIVAIDEESFQQTGLQWPWPRSYFAEIITTLAEGNPAVIVVDVLWYEPSSNPEDADQDGNGTPDGDEALAAAIANAGNVVLANDLSTDRRTLVTADGNTQVIQVQSYNVPLAPLEAAAADLGMANVERDIDGFVRRAPLFLRVEAAGEERLRFSWAAIAAATYLGEDLPQDGPPATAPASFAGQPMPAEACASGLPGDCLWINFRGTAGTFRYISAYQFPNGDVDPAVLDGKIVLIGATTEVLRDTFPTPFSAVRPMPGVEVKANLIDTMISGNFIVAWPVWTGGVLALLMAAIGYALSRLRRLLLGLGLVVALLAGYLVLFAVAFLSFSTILPYIGPSLAVILGFGIPAVERAVTEELERRRIRNAFSHYLSPTLVDQLASNPEQLKLGGERRHMTVVFSDVRGFTTISEQLDPADLIRLLNAYLTPMTDIILEAGGTIDKYMGDAIMAFWNAPLPDEAHARHACEAALKSRARLATLNEEIRGEFMTRAGESVVIRTGTGINTGYVSVGNMGSQQRFDYSVMGDAVNLASRLEGQCKTYGVDILLGEDTLAEAPMFAFLEVDLIQVKGKTRPVRIYTLLGDATVKNSDGYGKLVALQVQMLEAYRKQQWPRAREALTAAREHARGFATLGLDLTPLYEVYAARIAAFEADPPPADWDGVYVAAEK